MDAVRPWLPLIGEALPVAVVMLLAWRELRILKRLRLEREASARATNARAPAAEGALGYRFGSQGKTPGD